VALAILPFDLPSWWALAPSSFLARYSKILCASLNLTKSN
jgi:hypothetical protein